jgi:predicted molibdopterin-dependent oxidoreductase YjgC
VKDRKRKDRIPQQYTRLTHPLVRGEDGALRRANRDEALDRAADGFARARREHGPDAFGVFSCARSTNEMNYVAQKFTRMVMGTDNVDSCDRTCHAPSVAGLSAAFGSGGGTSSYREVEDTDLIVMWGSNARFAHPVFFQHVLKGIRNGARMFAIDPRRTSTVEWADRWLGLNAGTDIPLAHAIGREIIHAGLVNTAFVERATTGYEEYAAEVEPWTPSVAEQVTGVPAEAIRELAHAYATAERAQLCWTLGITEHHDATDNIHALINLSLLTGHVRRDGSGLQPLRGQSNVQSGRDMGAIPNRLPGFQDILVPEIRTKAEPAWDTVIQPRYGLNPTEMPDAIERGSLRAVYRVGENPAQPEADSEHTVQRLGSLDHLVVQDIFLTKTAEPADVVLPATAGRPTTICTSVTTASASCATSPSTPAATSGRTPSRSGSPGAASTTPSPSSRKPRSPTPPASSAATASRSARRAPCPSAPNTTCARRVPETSRPRRRPRRCAPAAGSAAT